MTVPLCSVLRPSRSDEPAAYDACWKLPDAPHACRRHPGWLWLGLHRLTQSQNAKSGAGKTREERMEAECLCYRARGLDLRCLHARDRRQIGTGHLKNSAGVVHYDLKETPVFLVFLWNKNKQTKKDITLKTITFTRTFKWSLLYLSKGQVVHVYVKCLPTHSLSTSLLNCQALAPALQLLFCDFRVICLACSPLSWWLTQALTAYQTRLAPSFVLWNFLWDAGHFSEEGLWCR